MKPEAHLQKARRLEGSLSRLDLDEDWEMVIEGVYGAALHRIAWICEERLGRHRDTHKGLRGFLVDNGLPELALLFQNLSAFRVGHWYGGKGDGGAARSALALLDELKREMEGRG